MSTTSTSTATQTKRSLPIKHIGGDVTASINFYEPPADNSTPFNYVETPPPGQPQRNFGTSSHEVPIHDIRGSEASFTLDRDAFQAVTNPISPFTTSPVDFNSETSIRSTYYPSVESLLLTTIPGAHKIIIFDHTIRRSTPDADRAPVARAHVDQTEPSTIQRVKQHTKSAEEATSLLKGRYRIINVWRPLNGTVESHPLAFASASSVDMAHDLVPVEHRYPHRTGETAQIRYNEKMKWYYWSAMGNQDRLLLKCWDSADGVGKCVPHTAFVDPNTPEGAKGRESIEVRALVFG